MASSAAASRPAHPAGLRAASFAISPAHVRTLLWLRFKLTLRRYTRSWQQIVGLLFGLLFLIPVAGGLAIVT